MNKRELEIENDTLTIETKDKSEAIAKLQLLVNRLNDEIRDLRQRLTVYDADEAGLRLTISHLIKAIDELNGVTP